MVVADCFHCILMVAAMTLLTVLIYACCLSFRWDVEIMQVITFMSTICSLISKKSCKQISQNLEAAIGYNLSLSNLTGVSTVVLTQHRSNFRAIGQFDTHSHGSETSRDLVYYHSVKRGPAGNKWIVIWYRACVSGDVVFISNRLWCHKNHH